MKSPITAPVLIDEAIRTLKNDIAPHIDAAHKYDILMCINALEISLRSLSADKADKIKHTSKGISGLIDQIRAGEYDDLALSESQSLLNMLKHENDQELRISVPAKKYQLLKPDKG